MALPQVTFSTKRAARPTVAALGKPLTYKPTPPALSIEDKAEFDDRTRALNRAVTAADKEKTTGSAENNRAYEINYKAARADRDRGQQGLNAVLGSSGFADSPAFAARGLYNLANQLAGQQQGLEQTRTTQNAALEKIFKDASEARTEGLAQIQRDMARRRNYQASLQRVGVY